MPRKKEYIRLKIEDLTNLIKLSSNVSYYNGCLDFLNNFYGKCIKENKTKIFIKDYVETEIKIGDGLKKVSESFLSKFLKKIKMEMILRR